MKLVNEMDNPLQVTPDDLPELLDWMMFLKVFCDQSTYMPIGWFTGKPMDLFKSPLYEMCLFKQLEPYREHPAIKALADRVAAHFCGKTSQDREVAKDRERFKLNSDHGFFQTMSLEDWRAVKESKVHWRLLETAHKEALVTQGIAWMCTHNSKDLHSSAMGISSVAWLRPVSHTYLGFRNHTRCVYVGTGNGKDAFYQGLCGACIGCEGKLYAFHEFFTRSELIEALVSAGASREWVEYIGNSVNGLLRSKAPDFVDTYFKQIYWEDRNGKVTLLTPMIASSVQCSLHGLLTGPVLGSKRRSVSKSVTRIGSNFNNGGRIAMMLGGKHNMLKCFPRKKALPIYGELYEVLVCNRLSGAVQYRTVQTIYRHLCFTYLNQNITRATDVHVASFVSEVTKRLHNVLSFMRTQSQPWLEQKLNEETPSASIIRRVLSGNSKPQVLAELTDKILQEQQTEFMSDAVRLRLRKAVYARLRKLV
ncbi:hypothetical protein ACI2KR_08040 [Pseudomonas luteola]